MNIQEALDTLDPQNDEHWTQDGLPKLDVLSTIFGEKLTRQQVTEANPTFMRPSNEDPDEEGGDNPDSGDGSDDTDEEDDIDSVDEGTPDEPTLSLENATEATAVALKEMEEADLALSKAQEKQKEKQAAYLSANELKQKLTPHNSNQIEIQRYLATVKRTAQQKAHAMSAVLNGVDQKDINPKSKLDQSMARRTGHGNKRPNFQPQQ